MAVDFKILCIEDRDSDVKLIQEYLSDSSIGNYSMSHCHLFRDGLDFLKKNDVDLVLLDLSLPDLEGLDTHKQIQLHFPHLPVVILTDLIDEVVAVNAVQQGAQDYLLKRDITPALLAKSIRYAIERSQFKKNIAEHERLDRMKDKFISTVSHELRTPLAIAKVGVENLDDGLLGELNEKQNKTVGVVRRNINRLERLINNLLDLSRLESGKSHVKLTDVSVEDFLTEFMEYFQILSKQKGIGFDIDIKVSSGKVYTDPDCLSQLLSNYLDNSFRYAQSLVIFSIEDGFDLNREYLEQSSSVNLKNAKQSDYFTVTIFNDGKEIPDNQKDVIFDKFEQVSRKTAEGYQGTGLGLSICKEIISRLRGRIGMRNVPGKGVEFYFILPTI